MDKKFSNLIGHCVYDLIDHGVHVDFQAAANVTSGDLACSGFFDDSVPLLTMATRQVSNDWRLLFLHEYCHFTQWKEGKLSVLDDIENLDDWYGEDCSYDYETAEHLTRVYQEIELDCEKRVIDILRRRKIRIDKKKYITSANAYIWLYQIALERKQWIEAGAYTRPKIASYCPETWITDLGDVPKRFRSYANRWCF